MPTRKTAKRKPRRGRPPLPVSEALGVVLPIRCRVAEKAAFEVEAARGGLTLSAWIRSALRNAAGMTES